MTETRRQKIEEEAREAYTDGKPLEDNPYPDDSDPAAQNVWSSKWLQMQRDDPFAADCRLPDDSEDEDE